MNPNKKPRYWAEHENIAIRFIKSGIHFYSENPLQLISTIISLIVICLSSIVLVLGTRLQ